MRRRPLELGWLIGAMFFVCGVATLLETNWDHRLPLVQGGSFAFLAPTIAVTQMAVLADAGWDVRLQHVQGAIIAGALAVRTFAPWVRHATNLDVLDATEDADTVAKFGRMADRLSEVAPRLESKMATMKLAVGAVSDMGVRDLLAARPPGPTGLKGRSKK